MQASRVAKIKSIEHDQCNEALLEKISYFLLHYFI